MSSKKSQTGTARLRLVKMPSEDETANTEPIAVGPISTRQPESSSSFVRSMTQFTDDLDQMIEQILRS